AIPLVTAADVAPVVEEPQPDGGEPEPDAAAAPVVPVPEPETAPDAQSEPEPETAPEPELAVTDAAPAAEPVEAEEPPADTFALSPYLTARRTAADAEGEPEATADSAPERATEPPAVTASVSPYGAGPVDDAAEPDWLVEARRQAHASAPQPEAEETPAPAAEPTPLPRVEAANDALITTAVLAPVPPAPVEAPDAAEADADDRTVIATRRRTVWRLKVGTDTYDLPESAVIIGRATASAAADRIGIADATRTMSKVHARLEPRNDSWYVTDMGSTNGTFVRGADGVETEAGAAQGIEVTGTLILGDLEVRLVRGEDG
ncbi:MAG: FHA domain-containing protein, partial [Demequina sp.]|uniref:FHA domain-containing protein n=1 Tax=Demequina sp. TaxID=2050685 RepID=UPI003A83D30E